MDSVVGRRPLPWAALLLVISVLVGSLVAGSESSEAVVAEAVTGGGAEAALLALMNVERTARGLAPLAPVEDLSGVARGWSAQMATNSRMEHNTNFSRQLCCWFMLAENVGYASPADDAAVSRLHQAFMNSDGHRKHILDTRATQVGVGVEVRNNTVWATVNFRQPKPGAPPALPRRQTPVQRIAGGDRISTAVAVSQQVFPRADAVVLARADQYPDALAGASLAAALGGPVLLTAPDHLSEAAPERSGGRWNASSMTPG
jgi:ell wall binding domain 2 (CWB2)/Cysteine-rich secretory protein family